MKKGQKQNLSDKELEEKIERDKKLLMITGVSFFMTLIVILWVFSLDFSLAIKDEKQAKEFGPLKNTASEIDEFSSVFSKQFEEARAELDKIGEESENAQSEKNLNQDKIESLKKELEKQAEEK